MVFRSKMKFLSFALIEFAAQLWFNSLLFMITLVSFVQQRSLPVEGAGCDFPATLFKSFLEIKIQVNY